MKKSSLISLLAALPIIGCMPAHHSVAALSSAPAPASGIVGHITPVIPYGYGTCGWFGMPPDPAKLKLLQSAGISILRSDFAWQDIEKQPGVYDFSAYDAAMAQLNKFGIKPEWTFDYTNTNYDNNQPPHTPEALQGFANFTKAAVAHFKGQGVMWEIWNEPNEPNFWKTGPNADQYAALVKAAVPGMHAADPDVVIMAGSISQINIPYITELMKNQPFSGVRYFSIHPYREGQPESVISDYGIVRNIIAKYTPPGQTPPKLVCSEWGYTTATGQTSEGDQARYLERMYLTNLLCGVNMTCIYNFVNDGSDPTSFENRYGIVHEDFTPKPAYTAMSMLLNTLRGYRFRHRIREATSADYKLLFQNGDKLALVTWTSNADASDAAQTPQIALIGKSNAQYASLMRLALAPTSPDDRPYPDALPKIPGVVASLTSASAPLSQQPNPGPMLANGGFESGTSSWTSPSLDAGQRLGITKAVSRSGKMSAFMSALPTNEASYFSWSQTVTPVTPGEQYTFTGYLKKVDVHGPAGWFVHVNGPNGSFVLNNTLTSPAGYSTGWDKVSTTFTIPPGGTSITLGTSLYGTGVAYFDDASLVKGTGDGDVVQQQGIPTAAGDAPADPVANGGFETGDPTPTGWSTDGTDAAHHLTLTADGHTGGKSAKMVVDPGTAPSYFSFNQYVHVTPGASYTFTAWVKPAGLQGNAGWFYHVYSGNNMLVNNTLNANAGVAGWSQVKQTIQVPPGADTIQIGTTLYGTGTAYFDDASLTKMP